MLSYTVPAGTTGDQTNTAIVFSSRSRHTTSYGDWSSDVCSSDLANLSITKTDGETAVTAGDGATHTYTITVSNAGPSNASGVDMRNTRLNSSNRTTTNPAQGSYTTGPNFTCALGTVASGSNATVTVS